MLSRRSCCRETNEIFIHADRRIQNGAEMSGNTFGKIFRITTHGESHGPVIGVVVDGVPAGMPLSEADVQRELDRRTAGAIDRDHPASREGQGRDIIWSIRRQDARHADMYVRQKRRRRF